MGGEKEGNKEQSGKRNDILKIVSRLINTDVYWDISGIPCLAGNGETFAFFAILLNFTRVANRKVQWYNRFLEITDVVKNSQLG